MNSPNDKFPTQADHLAFRRALAERYAAPSQPEQLPASLDEVVDKLVSAAIKEFRAGEHRIHLQVAFNAARFTDLPFAWTDPKGLNFLDTLRLKNRLHDAFSTRLVKRIDYHAIDGTISVNDHLDRLVAQFTIRMTDGFDPMRLFTELRMKK